MVIVDCGIVEMVPSRSWPRRQWARRSQSSRWNSTATTTRLLRAGLPVVRFGQGYANMSPAVKECERLILSRRLAHDGNPVMRWSLANVAIEQDAAGNQKISKARSRDKVDGAVALVMAVGVAATEGRHSR